MNCPEVAAQRWADASGTLGMTRHITESDVEDFGYETAVDVLHRVAWDGFGAGFFEVGYELLHEGLVDAQVLRHGFCSHVQVVDALYAFVGPAHCLL